MRTILSLALVTMLGSVAFAGQCPQESSAPLTMKMEMINGKRTMVIQKEIVICAHPPKPAVAYVTAAKTIDYQQPALELSLVPKILETVKTGGIK
jgi:hypothetical protein